MFLQPLKDIMDLDGQGRTLAYPVAADWKPDLKCQPLMEDWLQLKVVLPRDVGSQPKLVADRGPTTSAHFVDTESWQPRIARTLMIKQQPGFV